VAYSSDAFIFLIPVVLLAFYLAGSRTWQNALLGIVSIGFLGWTGASNVFVAVAMLGVALAFLRLGSGARERAFPWVVAVLLLNLAFFKYRHFIAGTFGVTLPDLPGLVWAVPLGISFYTFQIIASLHDVSDVESDDVPIRPGRFALFVLFFPHLIAGPICRIRQLYPQFNRAKRFSSAYLASGAHLFVLGYCKKVLIADPLARAIDPLWTTANAGHLSSPAAWAAVLGFYLQVYADFSGYTDMGRGVARAMGFRLPCNFRAPYLAASPVDFWSRWHITLSNFAKRFIYNPLAVASARRLRSTRMFGMLASLVLTMVLLGLWHGAAWRFVLFGLIQGLLLAGWHAVTKSRTITTTPGWLAGVFLTQGVLILSFVVFRAEASHAALGVLEALAGFSASRGTAIPSGLGVRLAVSAACVFAMQALDYSVKRRPVAMILLAPRRIPLAGLISALVFVLAFVFKQKVTGGSGAAFERFIYFDF